MSASDIWNLFYMKKGIAHLVNICTSPEDNKIVLTCTFVCLKNNDNFQSAVNGQEIKCIRLLKQVFVFIRHDDYGSKVQAYL